MGETQLTRKEGKLKQYTFWNRSNISFALAVFQYLRPLFRYHSGDIRVNTLTAFIPDLPILAMR
jgi:hypothetical protein